MLIALCALLSDDVRADEGMWLPEQLPDMGEELAGMGLELSAEQLADTSQAPLGAIVSFGEYCSASFISADGLIGTNHHCVTGLLQFNSDAEHDYGTDGYLAETRSDELSGGPTARAYVVDDITDVTESVKAKVRRWTKDKKRYELVEEAKKTLVAECEETPNHRCLVAEYYGGRQYRLISRLEIKDVRVVYAPPDSVGNYGDEIDNWMWPRHAGDFSLVRAYVAPDGSSAEYSEDNIPYSPPHHLQIDATGGADGEFVMAAGYPGRTYRYRTARSMAFSAETAYPHGVQMADDILAILHAESAKDPEGAARLKAPIGWISNGRKYRQGNLDNFQGSGVVERKNKQWAELVAWVEADPVDTKIYGPVLGEMEAIQIEDEALYEQEVTLGYMMWLASQLDAAHTAYRWSIERDKSDLERDSGYQDRDREQTEQWFAEAQETTWIPADRVLLGHFLGRMQALPEDKHPEALDAWLEEMGGVEAALEILYAEGNLLTADQMAARLDLGAAEHRADENPWMQLAIALEDGFLAPKRELDEARQGAWLRLMPLYMEALRQSREQVYPDANNTLRLTVGHVKGYRPADAVIYEPNTTLSGMVAKRGDWPFDAPERLVEAAADVEDSRWYDAELGDVPVCFLSTLDSTGGNSGSATLNAQGQLVGFLFDGNYESMSADWLFDDAVTRSIHVDIRYVLWILETEGATHILDELDISE